MLSPGHDLIRHHHDPSSCIIIHHPLSPIIHIIIHHHEFYNHLKCDICPSVASLSIDPVVSSVCAAQFQWDGLGRDQIPTAAVLAYGHPNGLGPWDGVFYKQGMEKNGIPTIWEDVCVKNLTFGDDSTPILKMSSDQLTLVICYKGGLYYPIF